MNAVDRQLLKNEFLNDMFIIGANDVGKSVIDTITEWGFFDMPASTKYHGTKEGGLVPSQSSGGSRASSYNQSL